MDAIEYLLFIPLLLYGIALSDLFGEWKKILSNKNYYWPYIATIITITEIGIYNVYIFFNLASYLKESSYFQYCLFLAPPFVFLLLVNFLTHKEDDEVMHSKDFFQSRIPQVFFTLAVFISLHFIPFYHFENEIFVPRLIAVAICLAFAYWRKMFLFYPLILIWILTIVLRILGIAH